MKDFRREYKKLNIPPSGADSSWFQARGYSFEKIIHQLLDEENLDPRTSYKIDGEQIDGSFRFEGRHFLLEAKWHKNELPASTIYQFKGKVDGKLVGTVGVFISMSGYSKDAIDALILGKALNVILFNKEDFDSAISREVGFRKVLLTKLRYAAEEGNIYFPFNSISVSATKAHLEHTESYLPASGTATGKSEVAQISDEIVIVCEGAFDRKLISLLVQRILRENSLDIKVRVIDTMGKLNVPKVAESVKSLLGPDAQLVLITDSDNDVKGTNEMIEKNLSFPDYITIIPDPSIENWLSTDHSELSKIIRDAGKTGKSVEQVLKEEVAKIDIEELLRTDDAFSEFHKTLITSRTTIPLVKEVKIADSPSTRPIVIRSDDVIKAFLEQRPVSYPLEYIKAICFASSYFLPIYYFAHLANFTWQELFDFIADTEARGKTNLVKRIKKEFEHTNYWQMPKTAEHKRKRVVVIQDFVEQKFNLNDNDCTDYVIFEAIGLMSRDQINIDYLTSKMLELYRCQKKQEGRVSTGMRKAICHIDHLLFRPELK